MTAHNDNWRTVLALALLALVVVLLSSCGETMPPMRLGSLPEKPSDMKPLPANATSAQYDAQIRQLTGMLAEAQAGKAQEREESRLRELAAWRTWTRWISALVIPLAIAAGALSLWFGFASLGIPIAGSAIAAAVALQLWAEAQAFLLPALAVIAGLGLVVLAIAFLRRDRATAATAKVGDLIEDGRSAMEVMAAKVDAEATQIAAGVFKRVQKARGKPAVPKAKREVA
jgi:hypothetical protein